MRRKEASPSDRSCCDVPRARGRQARARGFILVVAVALLLVISAAAFVQLAVVQQSNISTLRVGEEGAARAAAEGCLAAASAALAAYRDACRASDPTSCNLDGFLAGTLGGAPSVSVPAGSRPWGFFQRGESACLVRIEDNADEGVDAGIDLPDDDQDLALVVTVVGLHPARDVTPANAYAKAHARVTLRRTLALFNPGEATLSGTQVNLSGVSRVCGTGGVSGDDVDVSGGSCACGTVMTPAPPGNLPTAGCACELAPDEDPRDGATAYDACADTVTSTTLDPPNAITMPATPSIMQLERFAGDPAMRSTASRGECRFFMDRDGLVYIWDNQDEDALDLSELGTPLPAPLSGTVYACDAGAACATNAACNAYSKDPLEEPCDWKQFLSSLTLPIQCRANQTPCWKPIAHLGTGVQRTNLEAMIALWDLAKNLGPTSTHGAVATNGGALSFRKDKQVFLTPHKFRPDPQPFDTMCGYAIDGPRGSCASCDGTAAPLVYNGGWTLTAAADNPTMPVPFQLFVDDSRDVIVSGAGRNDNPEGRPLIGSIVTNGTITVRNGAKMGIAHSRLVDDPFVRPGDTPLDSLRTCQQKGYDAPPDSVAIDANVFGPQYYASVLSGGRCVLEDVGLLWGGIECDDVDWSGSGCIVGMIANKEGGGTIHLHPSPGYFHAVVTTFTTQLRLGGSLRMNATGGPITATGNIEVYGNATMFGALEANGTITLRDRGRVFGTGRLMSQRAATNVIEVPW